MPSDTDGVLQDVHWSSGAIGYFPTYTLGNLYSAQLMEAAGRDLGDLDAQFRRGDFAPLLGWMRTHIHSQGSLKGCRGDRPGGDGQAARADEPARATCARSTASCTACSSGGAPATRLELDGAALGAEPDQVREGLGEREAALVQPEIGRGQSPRLTSYGVSAPVSSTACRSVEAHVVVGRGLRRALGRVLDQRRGGPGR